MRISVNIIRKYIQKSKPKEQDIIAGVMSYVSVVLQSECKTAHLLELTDILNNSCWVWGYYLTVFDTSKNKSINKNNRHARNNITLMNTFVRLMDSVKTI